MLEKIAISFIFQNFALICFAKKCENFAKKKKCEHFRGKIVFEQLIDEATTRFSRNYFFLEFSENNFSLIHSWFAGNHIYIIRQDIRINMLPIAGQTAGPIFKKRNFFIFHGQRQALQLVLYKSHPLWVDKTNICKMIFQIPDSRFQIYKKCLWHEDWMHEHTSYFISVQIHFSVLHLLYSQREKVLFLNLKLKTLNLLKIGWNCRFPDLKSV